MPDIALRLGRDVLVVDGAMGTMLQRAAVPAEQCNEQLNITAPELIANIHRDYVLIGAHCVTTNTFGGTRTKLAEYGLEDQVAEINHAGVRLARRSGVQHVLADIGPSGRVLEPLGDATFTELHDVFAEQTTALAAEGPDAILIETMTDIAEARCAVLAARSVCDLPVLATVSFGLKGRMELSGTDPETAAVILEAAGASAIGINCGLGPEQMLPLVERMLAATSLPVIVQPNAGMPALVDGHTVFPATPDELGEWAERFVAAGASLVGSCCGSTPAFTAAIVEFASERRIGERPSRPAGVAVAGPRGVVRIGGGAPLALIGERINPTGKPRLAQTLRAGSMEVVREFGVAQQDAGAHLLDVNVGAAGVDAVATLPEAVRTLSALVDIPLVIDTTDPAALEAALAAYPGRALINSVSGEEASLAAVLPLAARFGAAVIVLALDDDGIPATAEGRLAVVERVRQRAHDAGLTDDDLVVDALTLAVATGEAAATETLSAVRALSERGLATVLGVSNVSHGLPGRAELNATFLGMAVAAGLTAAIVNPAESDAPTSDAAADALLGRDPQCAAWISRATNAGDPAGSTADPETPDAASALAAAISRGDDDAAPRLVDELVAAGQGPAAVIADILTPAIQKLGDGYGRGEVFLPQLIAAADAMKAAVARAKTYLPAGERTALGRVAFGTVKGDIHSIGKDICISMLESQGFEVHDLGVDVSVERFVEAARSADVICASALMTTTLPAMEAVAAAVTNEAAKPVLIGGAVVTAAYAASIGAGYSADAPGCVAAVRNAIGGGAA
jgi:5-methyltetrahydrofolate--homocysteine methyltransferase